MIEPISPKDIRKLKFSLIPDEVINAFNTLIAKNFSGKSAIVMQDDVIEEIVNKSGGIDRDDIFKNKWLDVEDLYRKNGWEVEYDQPGYNESYRSSYIFREK